MGATWSSAPAPAPAPAPATAPATASIDPEIEDKKLQSDKDYRSTAQKKVLRYVSYWAMASQPYNKVLVPNSPPLVSISLNLKPTESDLNYYKISKYQKDINDEDVWWKANPSLTKQQTNTRITKFTENIDPQLDDLQQLFATALAKLTPAEQKAITDNGPPEQAAALAAETASKKTKDAKASAADEARENSRTFQQNIIIGAKKALYYVSIAIYFLTALRLASFVANDLLYRPLAYRIIGFIYGFIGAPALLFYYIYREFTNTPPYYSFFPIYPYNQIDNPFGQLLYGYPNDIEHFLQSKRDAKHIADVNILANTDTILNELMTQREKRFEQSKAT